MVHAVGNRRLISWLYNTASKPLRERRVRNSLDYIASLKDIHRGRRGFVIGNGPSLTLCDLDKLQAEVTIASNKIYLAFQEVRWRPTYYTIVDDLVWSKVHPLLKEHSLKPIITSYLPYRPVPHHVVRHLGNATVGWPNTPQTRFSPDLTTGYYSGYSVTFENLQLAWHLGLDPIIAIGCDHYYAGEEGRKNDATPITNVSLNNHFIKGYRTKGEQVNPAPISGMTIAYKIAAQYAERHGRRILNATRGGYLEAFPRIDFDDLFSPNGLGLQT